MRFIISSHHYNCTERSENRVHNYGESALHAVRIITGIVFLLVIIVVISLPPFTCLGSPFPVRPVNNPGQQRIPRRTRFSPLRSPRISPSSCQVASHHSHPNGHHSRRGIPTRRSSSSNRRSTDAFEDGKSSNQRPSAGCKGNFAYRPPPPPPPLWCFHVIGQGLGHQSAIAFGFKHNTHDTIGIE